MASIHPTAIVEGAVELGGDVVIGAYCIIKGPVQIGAGSVIHEHSHIQGKTVIGSRCEIGPAAYVGLSPQHLHADRTIGQLIVGDQVIIRETATIHRSIKAGEENATRIGDRCFLMGGVHIAHDVIMEEDVIAANAALVAGHCLVGKRAFLGGGCAMHQFVRTGRLAIVGGNEVASQDIPPFSAVKYGGLKAYNAIGCRRAGLSQEAIRAIRLAYHCIHTHRLLPEAIRAITERVQPLPEIAELLEFLRTSKRGILPSVARREGERAYRATADSESN